MKKNNLQEKISRREALKKIGKTSLGLAGFLGLTSSGFLGCSEDSDIDKLKSYSSLEQRTVLTGDKYWIYASELQVNYPEKSFKDRC